MQGVVIDPDIVDLRQGPFPLLSLIQPLDDDWCFPTPNAWFDSSLFQPVLHLCRRWRIHSGRVRNTSPSETLLPPLFLCSFFARDAYLSHLSMTFTNDSPSCVDGLLVERYLLGTASRGLFIGGLQKSPMCIPPFMASVPFNFGRKDTMPAFRLYSSWHGDFLDYWLDSSEVFSFPCERLLVLARC